jgi:hypothetical protein
MTQLEFKVLEISTGSRADTRSVRLEVRHNLLMPPGAGSAQLPPTMFVVDLAASTADGIHEDQMFTMPMP